MNYNMLITKQQRRHCGLDPQSPENCLNHDFNKIFKMNRINLENPKNLNKIVVQDKNTRFTSLRGTKQSSSITNLSSFNFSKVLNFGKVKTACDKGNKAESLTATAWSIALRNKSNKITNNKILKK